MKLNITDTKGNAAGELEVRFELIENGRGTQAVHDTVVAYNAAQRSGTASTKTMGEVNGTGKKPWRQKGTGRARAGSFASPLWRGGGVVHGPKPRDFTKKVNRKVRSLSLRKALSERLKSGDVIIVDELKVPTLKTKEFVGVIKSLGLEGFSSLFVVGATDANVFRACQNIAGVDMTSGSLVNTYELLKFDKLVFTKAGFEAVEQRLAK
ncbi:MAG TPA: 50S ribosomal protein L4 [Candidatus Limnocylindria bacterium]|jgi:large subunit ribosomal protein L4|nr:50S ribosomal protein L4 [Candidatus Limnocylindria bacterium]